MGGGNSFDDSAIEGGVSGGGAKAPSSALWYTDGLDDLEDCGDWLRLCGVVSVSWLEGSVIISVGLPLSLLVEVGPVGKRLKKRCWNLAR